MKPCARCKLLKQLDAFARSSAAKDGLNSWCKDCARDYMRGRRQNPERRRAAAKASDRRYPERRRAREKVKDAVRAGRLPVVRTCGCVDCGRPAKAYDHHLGYDHPLAVEPVCYECHGRRSRGRGEHRKTTAQAVTS